MTGRIGTEPLSVRRSIPDRNAGRTEAARAYRLLHTGMAQAVADGLTPAHPCLVKGASQWDSKDRMQRRTPTAQEVWAPAQKGGGGCDSRCRSRAAQ
jgi:hypothetical protein